MKSIRLNKYLRQQIVNSVLEEFTDNFFKDLPYKNTEGLIELRDTYNKDIALSIWNKHYGDIPFDKIPVNMLRSYGSIQVAVEGNSYKYFSHHLDKNKYPTGQAPVEVMVEADYDELMKEVTALQVTLDGFLIAAKELRRDITPIIESFNTTKQLVETWSEMEKYIPANIADPSKGVTLPMLNISRLDAKIRGEK